MNDLLYLHLHNGESGNKPVAWRVLSPLIASMEQLALEAAHGLTESYVRHPASTSQASNKEAQFLIAGPPQQGSIILPFALQLPDIVNLYGQRPMMMMATSPTPLSEYISSLSDLASLALFVREVLFGERGAVARRTDQVVSTPPTTMQEKAVEAAAIQLLHGITPSIERLLQAAENTGCDRLEVQINEQSKIQLVMSDRRRSSSLLARQPRPIINNAMPAGYIFDPAVPQELLCASSARVKVKYMGVDREAIILSVRSPSGQRIVAIWSAKMAAPRKGEVVEVRGRRVERSDVTPQEEVPSEFENASDIFLVESARPTWS
ncbi:hypothetical protein [Brevundimonas sp.]|uniref:hypothetical protein n=1 Tax=Brevundimonas sp. TaxID=1871086 RepID=UPI00289BBA34|nr:hypothetical protein [Brevundimonas sp.]